MITIRRSVDLQAFVATCAREGRRIGFVPTMGNLHAGHHSLVAIARERSDVVVASVFVNPTQFGPKEDFARYPRTPEADAEGLAAHGCDVLFLPPVDEVYPYGAQAGVKVVVPELPDQLEGAIRPGHFDGVATVVAKLFNLVRPALAVFGRKDYQQLLVIRRLVRDMGYPIDVVGAPIVREAGGLAMSSRNQYLDEGERARALAIHATLGWMRERALAGDEVDAIEAAALARLEQAGLVPDYAVLRRADDLGPASGVPAADLVALVAARAGATRLIDNLAIAE